MREDRRRLASLVDGWRHRTRAREAAGERSPREERVSCPHCGGGRADWPIGLWADGGPLLCARCAGVADRSGRPYAVDVEGLLVPEGAPPVRIPRGQAPLTDVWEAVNAQLVQRQPLAASPDLAGYLRIVLARLGVREAVETRFVDLGEPLVGAVPMKGLLISLGLLAQLEDEAQLAFVLAREAALDEAGVVARRYAAARGRAMAGSRLGRGRRMGEQVLSALEVSWRLGYGVAWEREADRRASAALRAAGYDGDAPRRTLSLLESASLAGRGARFLLAADRADQLPVPPGPRGALNREVYRRAVGGFRVFLRDR